MTARTPIDFAHRANAQTVRDRKAIRQWRRLPSNGPLDHLELERKALRTEYRGGWLLGFLVGAGFVAFIWGWVIVGGQP